MTVSNVVLFGGLTLAGLVLSAFFSGLETGLYTINRVRLTVQAGRGESRAVILRDTLTRPARMLATILIGNNIANYVSSYGVAAIFDSAGLTPGRAVLFNALLLIPLLFIFGEILPKDLFRTHTDHWSYRCAPMLRFVERLFTWTGLVPIVQGFGVLAGRMLGADSAAGTSARQRMGRLIREGTGAGVLTETQTTLVDRAMALRHRTVGEEMVPWPRVVAISAEAGRAERDARKRGTRFTRFPIVEPDGQVSGVVSVFDLLLHPERPLRDMVAATSTLEAGQLVRDAIGVMRSERTTMGIVVDAPGGIPVGIVTLKDLVETLTGELAEW